MTPELEYMLPKWRAQFPSITEEEALRDLWHQGIQCNETFAAFNRRLAEIEDIEHNVVNHPNQLRGWHVGWVEDWKPEVLKYFATKGCDAINGFIGLDVLRVAIETHVIKKPNGYTQP